METCSICSTEFSLDDEGGDRLKEECDHFEKMILGIIEKHEVSE